MITNLKFQNKFIRIRLQDGYLNAEDMCATNNITFSRFIYDKQVEEYLEALSDSTNIDVSKLMEIQITDKGNRCDVWLHPNVAIYISQLISPKLLIFIMKVSHMYLSDDQNVIEELKKIKKTCFEEDKKIYMQMNKIYELENKLNK